MKIIEIEGARKLSGAIRISGAKNATVALIPAAILTDEEATICNVPEITDTDALCDILKQLKVKVNRSTESLVINPQSMQNVEIKEARIDLVDDLGRERGGEDPRDPEFHGLHDRVIDVVFPRDQFDQTIVPGSLFHTAFDHRHHKFGEVRNQRDHPALAGDYRTDQFIRDIAQPFRSHLDFPDHRFGDFQLITVFPVQDIRYSRTADSDFLGYSLHADQFENS